MLDSKLLLTLASVIETNGFERAAAQLGITQSAVSQRIKQLESLLGQPLLIRSQPIEATSVGKTLLQHYKQIKMLELDLMQHLKPESRDGVLNILSIGADADSLSSWLIPALLPLMHQHDLQLRILPSEHLPDPATAQCPAHLCGWLSHSSTTIHGSQCLYLGDIMPHRWLAPTLWFCTGNTRGMRSICNKHWHTRATSPTPAHPHPKPCLPLSVPGWLTA